MKQLDLKPGASYSLSKIRIFFLKKIKKLPSYHKDLETWEDLKKLSLLVTVTLLGHVAHESLVRHHTTFSPTFLDLHGTLSEHFKILGK